MIAVADNRTGGLVIIWITIVAGMVLAVVPMPQFVPLELGFLRPDWVAMVLVYWIIALPHRVGIPTAWLAGIAVDVLLGSLIGQHALAYVLIAYVVASLYQRLRMFSVWQQAHRSFCASRAESIGWILDREYCWPYGLESVVSATGLIRCIFVAMGVFDA